MRWGRLAVVAALLALAFAGTAVAAWQTGIYAGKLRSPGYGSRGQTPIRLLVSKTQVRVLSGELSLNCGEKKRVQAKIGPLRPMKIRVRPDTGGAQFSLNQRVGATHVTIAGGITPGKPLQGLLDATRYLPTDDICTDSALFTAKPR